MTDLDATLAERTRLIGVMDHYLGALVDRDPGRLRLAPDFRYTEDAQAIPPGSGIWRTIRSRTSGGHYFVDPEQGQVEYWGLADEMGETAILSIRLKVAGRVLSEAETIVTRAGPLFEPAAAMKDATGTFHQPIEPRDRGSREALIAAANAYFDSIEQSDGDRAGVRDDCRRLVNGVVDSADDPTLVEHGEEHRALSVSRQISEGHYRYIEALRDRRYPLIDTARGLVVCHLLFDHPGDLPRPDGEFPIKAPNSMLFTEVFKVVAGRIEEIWALGSGALPYGSRSGW
jgi:hypothetical protein